MSWRTLRRGELDHECIWLAVSIASFFLALAWLYLRLPLPQCWFHRVTGAACPTCGTTRVFLQLTHGNIAGAFMLNPLATAGFVLGLLFNLYAAVVLAFRLPRFRIDRVSVHTAKQVRTAAAVTVLVNWAWLLYSGI